MQNQAAWCTRLWSWKLILLFSTWSRWLGLLIVDPLLLLSDLCKWTCLIFGILTRSYLHGISWHSINNVIPILRLWWLITSLIITIMHSYRSGCLIAWCRYMMPPTFDIICDQIFFEVFSYCAVQWYSMIRCWSFLSIALFASLCSCDSVCNIRS